MADQGEVLSALIALQFVGAAVVLFLFVPGKMAATVVPMVLLFVVALVLYFY